MKTIYLDSDFKCHTTNDGTMRSIETHYFDRKCDIYIEGYRFVPIDESWIREDGEVFEGEMVAPWKDYNELDVSQREYERQLLSEYEMVIAELDAALLDIQYTNLVEDL